MGLSVWLDIVFASTFLYCISRTIEITVANNQKKRGRGRPRLVPVSGEQLRQKAQENLRKAEERRALQEQSLLPPSPDTAEVIEEASAVTRKHRYTKEEMQELRDKLDYIYQKYLQEQWEEEAQKNKELNKRLHQEALSTKAKPSNVKLMSETEWNTSHGLKPDGTKKRGPVPKRKKLVWELEPGEKGTAAEPSQPIDVDAMETELETKLIEEHIKEQQKQPQFIKGKRVRSNNRADQNSPQTKSFWI